MKLLTKLLTKNFQKVPLLWIDLNMKKFKESGVNGSCVCNIHLVLSDDMHIKSTMNDLCDYIRKNYNMKDIV